MVFEDLVGDFVVFEMEEVVCVLEEGGVGGEDFWVGSDEEGSGDILEILEESGVREGGFGWGAGGVAWSEFDGYEDAEKGYHKEKEECGQFFLHRNLTM